MIMYVIKGVSCINIMRVCSEYRYLSKHSLTDFYLFSFHAQDLPCHLSLIELKSLFFWVSCRLKRGYGHIILCFPKGLVLVCVDV